MSLLHRHGLLAAAALVCSAPAQDAAADRFAAAIALGRTTLPELVASGAPAVQVAVAHEGALVWSEAFGYASLELGVRATPKTRFGIGSISKALTMATAMTLAAEGRLDIDSTVEHYIVGFPHLGRGITTRLLAAHLSGWDDVFAREHRSTNLHFATTGEALLRILEDPLISDAGTTLNYATGTYTVIAGVLESIEQRPYDEIVRARVLAPLGLEDTVLNDRSAIIERRTVFYARDAGGHVVNAPFFDPSHKWAGAGWLSTAEDLVAFGSALIASDWLAHPLREQLFTPVPTVAGEGTGFALGFRVDRDDAGRRVVHQPGGGIGISGWLVLFPDEGLAFAILSNLTGAPVGGTEFGAVQDAFLSALD